MSLKLRLASIYTPGFLLKKELDRLSERTLKAMDDLLDEQAVGGRGGRPGDVVMTGSLEERRTAMTKAQNERASALVAALGREEAVRLGRRQLHAVGVAIGEEMKKRMAVGESLEDLQRAARVMYKVLGIDFEMESKGGRTTMIVHRCALSRHYSAEACEILSATDEGVVEGLNPRLSMRFEERIAAGSEACKARIEGVRPGEVRP